MWATNAANGFSIPVSSIYTAIKAPNGPEGSKAGPTRFLFKFKFK